MKKMRILYTIPLLLLYLGGMTYYFYMKSSKDLNNIIIFSIFIASYAIAYLFGMKNTIDGKDSIIKNNHKFPYMFPISFFIIFNVLLLGIYLIFQDNNLRILFTSCFLTSTLLYFIVIYFLIIILKAEYKREKRIKDSKNYKKKILLINPVNECKIGLSINPSGVLPPLALGIIAALTPDDIELKLIDEHFERYEYEDADLVAMTAVTSATPKAYRIAKLYKDKKIPVVLGGIHATMLPDECLQYVDSVVIGEVENVWKDVLDDFLKGKLKKKYKGDFCELKNAVVPKREIFSKRYLFGSMQTSRGCPLDCDFCTIPALNEYHYRLRPIEEVLDELESLPQRNIFFLDDNLIGYGKKNEERAMELFKGMVKRKLGKKWICQASLNFGLNEELLKWAKKAGCKMTFLGIESNDPAHLEEFNKRVNLKMKADYDTIFKNINKHGIAVFGEFIFGGKTETVKSIYEKTDFILKKRIDSIHVTILTPLPGTRLHDKYVKNKWLVDTNFPDDWGNYSMTELTHKLDNLSKEEFLATLSKCARIYYSKKTLIKKFFRTWVNTGNIETAMWSVIANFNYRKVVLANLPYGKQLKVSYDNVWSKTALDERSQA